MAVLDGETPFQRGVTHGREFEAAIDHNLETYLDRFEHNGVDQETAREHAAAFIPLIEEANEDYLAEMEGVADGSGCSLEDVALINVRYEILFSAYAAQTNDGAEVESMAPEADGCTAFGVQPEVTADGCPYIGQNWDWIPAVETFLMDIRRPDGPDALSLTEAGLVGGKFGLNEHGIGYVVNGLVSANDGQDPRRRPSHISHYEMLNADRLSTAISAIISGPSPCSGNVLLGHPSGELIDIESTPDEAYYLYPEAGILTHANHFETEGVTGSFEQLTPDSLCRGPRMRRLLEQHSGAIDVETMQTVLRDHFDKPGSICSHVDPELPDHEVGRTNASVIMDLTERRLLLTHGPPCESAYTAFAVGG